MSDARDALEASRERHRRRSRGRRALVIFGGFAAAALGVVLVVPLPEVGLPLLVWGLRLLALRYRWAARAYLPVAGLWERIKALPASVKLGLGILVIAIVAGLVWWLY